jgi:hypothetical protein
MLSISHLYTRLKEARRSLFRIWRAKMRSSVGAVTRVYRFDPTTGRRELLREFAPADLAAIHANTTILTTPDGKGYAYSVNRKFSDLFLIEGLK